MLVQNNLSELALALGSHFLKNLDKFVLEFHEQKSFILKFIFQFDKVSQIADKTAEINKQVEDVTRVLVDTVTNLVNI